MLLVTLGRVFQWPWSRDQEVGFESMGRSEDASEKLAQKVGGGGWWSEGFRE